MTRRCLTIHPQVPIVLLLSWTLRKKKKKINSKSQIEIINKIEPDMCITVSNLIQNLVNLQNKFVASVQRWSSCGCFTKIATTHSI
jgi:hypothetical protein